MRTTLTPYSLAFEDRQLEAAYLSDALSDYVRPLRIALVVGIALYAGFLWVDRYLFGRIVTEILVNRVVVCALATGLIWLTRYPRAFVAWVRPAMSVLHVTVGLGTLHMTSLHPDYEGGLYASLMFFPLLARAQFQFSMVANIGIFACFALMRASIDGLAPVLVEISMLLSAVVVIGLAAWVKERSARIAFAQRQALAEARDLALAASRAKSTFLANMSHELRTPLNAVIGYGEMLQDDAREAGHDGYLPDLGKIVSSGRHLLGLIDDILDLSKIEAGKVELHVEVVEIGGLVDGVLATVRPLVERNDNRLEWSVEPGLPALETDATRLRQILLNLLGNAAKFTRRGTVRLEVRLVREDDGDRVVFRVVDTGIGMTDAQVSRIFEAFGQAEATTTRDYGGTGLGLTISKHFAEMLGGGITVSSRQGEGSTFSVWLPVRRARS